MLSNKSRIITPVENNHPSFLIIPFRKDDIFNNTKVERRNPEALKKTLEVRFPDRYVTLTSSGREALKIATKDIASRNGTAPKFQIKTTSNNYYISSCVTNTIEESGFSWHRELNDPRDALIVNHEFGFIDSSVQTSNNDEEYLIEDSAFAFASTFHDGHYCGSYGDYSILSFSKFFPIQIGGALISKRPIPLSHNSEYVLSYVSSVVLHYIDRIDEWCKIRKELHSYYEEVFESFGCRPYFKNKKGDIPGVFLFKTPENIKLDKLKSYYWSLGVQCSVFYGDQAFFLPLNQFTKREHIDFFGEIFVQFLKNEGCKV